MGRPSLALTFSSAAYIVTGFVVTVGLARILAPSGFGAYAVVTAILTLVNLVVSRGVPVAATRTIASDPSLLAATMRVTWRTTLAIAAIVTIVTMLAAWPASLALGDEARVPLQVGAIAAVTFAIQALVVTPLNGLRMFGWQALTRTTYAGVRVVLIITGALIADLTGAIIGYVLAPLIASIPARFAPRPDPALAATTLQSGPSSRMLIRQALPLLLTSAWVSLLLTIDLIAFRTVGSAFDTGLYGAAGTLGHVSFYLMAMLPTETLPRIAAELDSVRRRVLGARLLDDALVMLAPPTLLLATFGPWLLERIFGDDYAAGGQLVAPLALATAAVTVHAMLVAIDGAYSRLRPAVAFGAAATLVMALAVALIGERGVEPAAWAAASVAVLCAGAHWAVTIAAGRIDAPTRRALVLALVLLTVCVIPAAAGIHGVPLMAAGFVLIGAATLLAWRRLVARS